jgi:type I restriction enzyme S subunit
MPATIEEQREIVTILDALDRKIDLHRKKLRLLDELFKAVLRKLLAKHMRVEELDLSVVAAHTANTLHISEAGTDEFTLGTGSDTSGGESERGVER